MRRECKAVCKSSPIVLLKRESKSTKTDSMRSKEVGGVKWRREKSTKGQQKLGEGENWELRLLAGSFSVLPRISTATAVAAVKVKVKGGVWP